MAISDGSAYRRGRRAPRLQGDRDSTGTLCLADGIPLPNYGLEWFAVRTISPQGVVTTLIRTPVWAASQAVDATRNVYIPGKRISPTGQPSGIDTSAAIPSWLYGHAIGADGTYYFAVGNTIWRNPPGRGSEVPARAGVGGLKDQPFSLDPTSLRLRCNALASGGDKIRETPI